MTAQNVGTRNCSGKGKDILPLGTATSIIWILSERTTVNWQTNLGRFPKVRTGRPDQTFWQRNRIFSRGFAEKPSPLCIIFRI